MCRFYSSCLVPGKCVPKNAVLGKMCTSSFQNEENKQFSVCLESEFCLNFFFFVPFWVPFDFAFLIYKLIFKQLIKILPTSILNVALCTISENIWTYFAFPGFYISIVNSQLFDSCCSDLWFQFSSFY